MATAARKEMRMYGHGGRLVQILVLCGGLILVPVLTLAQRSIPQPTTPLEQLAELGEVLAALDVAEPTHQGQCRSAFDGKPLEGKPLALCIRQKERDALWRAKHTKLCAELKIQKGLYGCPTTP
jgi:hypothetical protein